MKFAQCIQVIDGEHDLSRTTGTPSLQKSGSARRSDNLNGGMRTLGGDFSRAQRQVLSNDEGHGRRIMHRGHAPHPPQAIHSPMPLIR